MTYKVVKHIIQIKFIVNLCPVTYRKQLKSQITRLSLLDENIPSVKVKWISFLFTCYLLEIMTFLSFLNISAIVFYLQLFVSLGFLIVFYFAYITKWYFGFDFVESNSYHSSSYINSYNQFSMDLIISRPLYC